jgi:hypothetical protein
MAAKWSDWTTLGGPKNRISGLIVGKNQDGRLEVFASDGHLWHVWQTAPNGSLSRSDWGVWEKLGSKPVAAAQHSLSIGRNKDGRLEVFSISKPPGSRPESPLREELWSIWQTVPNGGWSDWCSLGRPVPVGDLIPADFFVFRHTKRVIDVATNQDGRLEVFAQHWGLAQHSEFGEVPVDHFWHVWQIAPGNGWSGWRDAGRPPQRPGGETSGHPSIHEISRNPEGRLEMFTVGPDFGPWHIWQTAPNNGWSDWRNANDGSVFPWRDFAVGQNHDGRLEVFVISDAPGSGGSDVRHVWQTAPNNGWSEWASLGAPSSSSVLEELSVKRNGSGGLDVFVIDGPIGGGLEGGKFWTIGQSTPNNGWRAWENLGRPPVALRQRRVLSAVGQNQDGRLELFVADQDGEEVWHTWQT